MYSIVECNLHHKKVIIEHAHAKCSIGNHTQNLQLNVSNVNLAQQTVDEVIYTEEKEEENIGILTWEY